MPSGGAVLRRAATGLELTIMLKAVLFDLDDTLLPDEPAADGALLAVGEHAKVIHNIPPASLRRSVRRIARELWRAHPVVSRTPDFELSSWEALSCRFTDNDPELAELGSWAPTFRCEVWTRALAENGFADPMLSEQLGLLYAAERRLRYRPFPDAVPCLESLRPRFALGLVTNGPSDLQRDKLAASGLAPFFPVTAISREVGVPKPNPRIFASALERLGVEPAEAVHVGDSLRRDVAGAQAAGIRAIWLNRSGSALPDCDRPEATITSLTALPEALNRLA